MERFQTTSVFRVPIELVRNKRAVVIEKLVQVENHRPRADRIFDTPYTTLSSVYLTSTDRIDLAWKIVPVLFQDDMLYLAVRFLKASQDDFFVYPGELDEVLYNPDLTASTGFGQVNFENALQNAFKAIEAVVGDPPKDDAKFFEKIRAIGLEPNEEVGYSRKESLHVVIRRMSDARDKKSAHGSSPNRLITIGELNEYQECASLLVWAAIENRLGAGSKGIS